MQNDTIYYLSLKDIREKKLVENYIHCNYDLNYYWSDDFSEEFYIELAYFGFISVSYFIEEKFVLLPEIQFEYSILEFKDLHISKKVKKLLKKDEYTFKVNQNFEKVLNKIESYHANSWCTKEYKDLLIKLINYKHKKINFTLNCFELYNNNILTACEIGYTIGKTYTSLSAYTNKDFKNQGSLQLVLLAKFLEKNSYDFWNLGHAKMKYKTSLGAKTLKRDEFLTKWNASIRKTF